MNIKLASRTNKQLLFFSLFILSPAVWAIPIICIAQNIDSLPVRRFLKSSPSLHTKQTSQHTNGIDATIKKHLILSCKGPVKSIAFTPFISAKKIIQGITHRGIVIINKILNSAVLYCMSVLFSLEIVAYMLIDITQRIAERGVVLKAKPDHRHWTLPR